MPHHDDTTALDILGLMTIFNGHPGIVHAVRGVSLSVRIGEVLGIVGESGCGKTVTALSIMRLLPRNAKITRGAIMFEGRNLLTLRERAMQQIRGRRIAMVFQDAASALNPVLRVGPQVAEALQIHHPTLPDGEVRDRVREALQRAGIPDPQRITMAYPHELSGGLCQRVMIAMGMINSPTILIADEPTTALDVTVQKQILDQMRQIRMQTQMSILFITHNPGVVAEICDRVVVMYAGTVVEVCSVDTFFRNAQHPYTQNLLNSIPSIHPPHRPLPIRDGHHFGSTRLSPGCPFAPRCPIAESHCSEAIPPLIECETGHETACWVTGR